MKVAACQLPDVRHDVAYATELICDYTARAERSGAALVCFPECFLQGYTTDGALVARHALDVESFTFDRWLEQLRGLEATLVVGLIERRGADFFNTAVVIHRGALICRYRKIHLLDAEQNVFRAGTETAVVAIAGTNVGLAICYDLNFATTVQASVLAGASLVVAPCNNMMRRATAEKLKDTHNAVRCDRARELGVWLLTSDVTGERDGRISYGPTALIRPDGFVEAQVPLLRTGTIAGDIA